MKFRTHFYVRWLSKGHVFQNSELANAGQGYTHVSCWNFRRWACHSIDDSSKETEAVSEVQVGAKAALAS